MRRSYRCRPDQGEPAVPLGSIGGAKPNRNDPSTRKYALVAGRHDLLSACPGGCCRHSRHLSHRLQRIRPRLWAVEIAAINHGCARALKNNEHKHRQPFHRVDANRSVGACQRSNFFAKRDCMMSMLRENLRSVRGYGLRTCEPRQGRNAAAVA
jgi:hypothetical protein